MNLLPLARIGAVLLALPAGAAGAAATNAGANPALQILAQGYLDKALKTSGLEGKATLKALPADKGAVGLDYDLTWKNPVTPGTARDSTYTVDLHAKGFLTRHAKDNTANACDSGILAAYRGTARLPQHWLGTAGPGGATEVVEPTADTTFDLRRDVRELALTMNNILLFDAGVNGRFVSTQDVRTYTFNVGPKVAINLPWPGMFSRGFISSRALNVEVAYEYLAKRHYDSATLASALQERKNMWVANLGSGFEIGPCYLDVGYGMQYFATASIPASAVPKFSDFILFRLGVFKIPVGNKPAWVSVTYTKGKLAPAFKPGRALGAGFSIDL